MNLTVRHALRNYFKLRTNQDDDTYVFMSKRQKPISLRSMQSMINNLSKKTKITRVPVTAHTLRHTFASNYLRANPNHLVELAQLMGHDSLNTTAIYTKSTQAQLTDAIEKSEINIYGDT